jgi:hypothetical protein
MNATKRMTGGQIKDIITIPIVVSDLSLKFPFDNAQKNPAITHIITRPYIYTLAIYS